MKKADILKKIEKSLIVSCQAFDHEPLRDSFMMQKMALAAKVGGAVGIRANGVEDITAIRKEVNLPIIAILKRYYEDSSVFITATMREIDELMTVNPEIIAVQATKEIRPFRQSLEDFVSQIRAKYPNVLLMADCSTLEELGEGHRLGFDFLGTTLVGHTDYSKDVSKIGVIKEAAQLYSTPIIAEGGLDTPKIAKQAIDAGAFCVVVGGAITRPNVITKCFVDALK